MPPVSSPSICQGLLLGLFCLLLLSHLQEMVQFRSEAIVLSHYEFQSRNKKSHFNHYNHFNHFNPRFISMNGLEKIPNHSGLDFNLTRLALLVESWPLATLAALAKPALSLTMFNLSNMLDAWIPPTLFHYVPPPASRGTHGTLPWSPGLSNAFQIVAFLCLSHRLAVDQHIVQVLQVWQVCQPGFAGWFQNLPRRKLMKVSSKPTETNTVA